MTRLICDMCGREITDVEIDHARLVLATRKFGKPVTRDLHISCATRLNNKIDSFFAEVKEKEDAYAISF